MYLPVHGFEPTSSVFLGKCYPLGHSDPSCFKKIGQGLLLTGDPHVMVVPPKYFFHAINVQQLIYVLYNFDEIALSHMVKEIQAILCFVIFGKNSKIQNGCHFWGGENFLKIANNTFLRYPVGRKFRRNRSISHGLGDMSTFAFFSIQNS